MSDKKRPLVETILVTGGKGLVGKGIEAVIKRQNPTDEHWVFLGSADGDLKDKEATRLIFEKHRPPLESNFSKCLDCLPLPLTRVELSVIHGLHLTQADVRHPPRRPRRWALPEHEVQGPPVPPLIP